LSNLAKGLTLVIVILAIGAGLVIWKKKAGGAGEASFNSISNDEIQMLLSDVAQTDPMILKDLAEHPEKRKLQLDNLKQLLAFASQAKKEGLADEPENKLELQNIRDALVAVNYDTFTNKDKGPLGRFAFIKPEQVKEFWGEDDKTPAEKGWLEKIGLGGTAEGRKHQAQFDEFLDTKIKLLKKDNPQMADQEITDAQKQQAKEYFAKIQIYKKEFDDKVKAGQLDKAFVDKVNLQVKLQQAQFLARAYSEKLADKTKVTDEDVAKYISEHPEFDTAQKKAKAQEILDKAKNGEDFAALANQYSEDPGNKNPKGEPQGGLYKDVPKGRMVPAFEQAALALEPGQIAPNLVESDFGYHIIKLEKKNETKDAQGNPTVTYDVRHILISTTYQDPQNPSARPVPVKEFVRSKLEQEKEKQVIDDIVASNHVSVPDDFTVPEVTDEQIQQSMKNRQMPPQMQPGNESEEPETAPDNGKTAKPAPKKGK
jgi:hypothetical protein